MTDKIRQQVTTSPNFAIWCNKNFHTQQHWHCDSQIQHTWKTVRVVYSYVTAFANTRWYNSRSASNHAYAYNLKLQWNKPVHGWKWNFAETCDFHCLQDLLVQMPNVTVPQWAEFCGSWKVLDSWLSGEYTRYARNLCVTEHSCKTAWDSNSSCTIGVRCAMEYTAICWSRSSPGVPESWTMHILHCLLPATLHSNG